MNEQILLSRLEQIEYHQKLLIKVLNNPSLDFYKLVIENGISEQEVIDFFTLCDELSMKMEKQKAEGFVYFHPLFHQLTTSLPANLDVKKVLPACIKQGQYVALMQEFLPYI